MLPGIKPFTTLWLLLLLVRWDVVATASEPLPQQLYELTTVTAMPHLEENLRYTRTSERRCLTHQELFEAFAVLAGEAFRGCRLEPLGGGQNSVILRLACAGDAGTTGTATWTLRGRQYRGRLEVRLGAKNMTFHQRVAATPAGDCGGEPDRPADGAW